MASKTSIEWCDRSANPIRAVDTRTGKRGWFCVHKSGGCTHCYSETLNRRFGNGMEFIAQNQRHAQSVLDEKEIASWRRLKPGTRVFVCDMTDLLLESHPDEMVDAVFRGFLLAPQVTFQVLTKRAMRLREYFAARPQGICIGGDVTLNPLWQPWPLPNVWIGVSVEDQKNADERIPDLLQTPAAVRFISAEPLLSGVDLSRWLKGTRRIHVSLSVEGALANRSFAGFTDDAGLPMTPKRAQEELKQLHRQGVKLIPMSDCPGFSDQTGCPGHRTPPLDWVIGGGESGPGARPCHPCWARDLRDQCTQSGVAFFWKQWGAWAPITDLPDYDDLYEPAPKNDPEAARRCRVRTEILQLDGRFEFAFPQGAVQVFNVGKKRAGRLLDGRTWDQLPEVARG